MNNFNKEFYTEKEVLDYLKIKQELLYKFIDKGWIKTYAHPILKFKIYFNIKEIESFRRIHHGLLSPSEYEFAHSPEEALLLIIQSIENETGGEFGRFSVEFYAKGRFIYSQNPKQI